MNRNGPCEALIMGIKEEHSRQKSLIQEITCSNQGNQNLCKYMCEFETRIRLHRKLEEIKGDESIEIIYKILFEFYKF